jgi:hypothetical protein
VLGLLNVVGSDVGHLPNVFRVLSSGVSARLSFSRATGGALAGIFMRNANRIEIKIIVVRDRIPENNLMAATETPDAVKAMAKCPHEAVPEDKAQGVRD